MDKLQEIIEVCQRLSQKNMLASADGNVSLRESDGSILITPTGKNKARLKPEDMAMLTLEGKVLRGQPSSERLMHLEVYRSCEKARAVVHAHPPTAIAWTVARPELKELPSECLSELILAVGRIPIALYARPGTAAMGEVLRPFLPDCRVILMARHGAIAWGEDLEEAYNGMERLEHVAGILMKASMLGGLSRLPEVEVEALREMRKKLGDRTL